MNFHPYKPKMSQFYLIIFFSNLGNSKKLETRSDN